MNALNNTSVVYCIDSETVRSIKIATALLLGIASILGNIFVIVLAVGYTVRKNLHHLIINMAVSDILVAFLTETNLIPALYGLNLFDLESTLVIAALCKTLAFLLSVTRLVSLVCLFIISVERFRVTRSTTQRSRPYSLKRRAIVVATSWLVPMLLNAYVLVLATDGGRQCWYPWSALVWFNIHHSFTAITFGVTVILSVLSLNKLARTTAIQAHLSEASRAARTKQTSRIVKMVLWSLVFYSSNLPLIIYKVLEMVHLNGYEIVNLSRCKSENVTFILKLITLINPCFGPGTYVIFLADFRQAAKTIFRVKSSIQQQQQNQQQQQHQQQQQQLQRRQQNKFPGQVVTEDCNETADIGLVNRAAEITQNETLQNKSSNSMITKF